MNRTTIIHEDAWNSRVRETHTRPEGRYHTLSEVPGTPVGRATGGKMKVKVDRELCIGISSCVAVASTVFALDGENKAVATNLSSVSEKKLLEAAESCPQDAIIVEDDTGRQLYPYV
jgi:ferredoxin